MSITVTMRAVPPSELERFIARELASELNALVGRAVPPIRSRLAAVVLAAVDGSPEAQSLRGGELQAQLGVVDPDGAIELVAQAVAGGIAVTQKPFRPVGGRLVGGMSVGILNINLSEVLGLPVASFHSEGGFAIDWLRWLLTAGDALLNTDYEFVGGTTFPRSRTGLGVMRVGGGWGVPPEFSGTARDNWLTRALAGVEPEIEVVLAQELNRA